jgi:D-alanyl-D-alanine endopeptidase (penicillin-binding protein 7)
MEFRDGSGIEQTGGLTRQRLLGDNRLPSPPLGHLMPSRLHAFAWVLPLSALVAWQLLPAARADLAESPPWRADLPWAPPEWHPNPDALESLVGTDLRGPPKGTVRGLVLKSRNVFIYDVDAAEVLYERAADDVRPVASLTKFVSGLAFASEGADLDVTRCVDMDFWPSRSGAHSKLSTGECYTGWEYLGAAMVASDNRGAYGLQVLSGLPFDAFIARMDEVSADLRMTRSSWGDPSGLEDANLSTARDMTRAAIAVSAHPQLSIAATAPSWKLTPSVGKDRKLFTTNKLAGRKDLDFLAAKTGYTDTAGYCFTGVVRTDSGRTLAVTLLGGGRSKDRWADLERIVRWAD